MSNDTQTEVMGNALREGDRVELTTTTRSIVPGGAGGPGFGGPVRIAR